MRRVGRIYQLPRRTPDRDGTESGVGSKPLSDVGDMCVKRERLSAQGAAVAARTSSVRAGDSRLCDLRMGWENGKVER